jgi:hypothetical protein
MRRINLGRVVLGGIAAGIVLDICEGLMRGVLLRDQGAAIMIALGLPSAVTTKQLVAFNVWGLVVGVFTAEASRAGVFGGNAAAFQSLYSASLFGLAARINSASTAADRGSARASYPCRAQRPGRDPR